MKEQLLLKAWEARKRAYAPYSKFRVGAAILASSGEMFTGCNIENLSFGLTVCAERVALFSAVASGATKFRVLAVVADTDFSISPCGACRQVLAEFGMELLVVSQSRSGSIFEATLSELLPRAKSGILNLPDDTARCST